METEAAWVEAGRTVLGRGEWERAREAFAAGVGADPASAEAHEGLGHAAWWLDDARTPFAARDGLL